MTSATWTVEHVAALAPTRSARDVAESTAMAQGWSRTGADARAVWGCFQGSGSEPYDVVVDHVELRWRCTCPSRRPPCKHVLGLLLRWVRNEVPLRDPPARVAGWLARRPPTAPTAAPAPAAAAGRGDDRPPGGDPSPPGDRPGTAGRDEQVSAARHGLRELDRWLEDRLRAGLVHPSVTHHETWSELAARLVDARAGALANRVRRIAAMVGADPRWHERVLAEMGVLHLLAQAGGRLADLPDPLADLAAAAVGWRIRQADVLAGVPETATWVVAGRSDTREDRIEVRRTWLVGADTGRWAMVLSFAAYRQSLDETLEVGTALDADVHRYPGGSLRAIVGRRLGDVRRPVVPPTSTVREACEQVGLALAVEPWLERHPATVLAAPALVDGRWVLGDHTGSLPMEVGERALAVLLAAGRGDRLPITVEWTPGGVVPVAVHLDDRTLDVGARADPSFVGAA